MSNLKFKEYYRNNLPHIQHGGVILAISYRLAFNLPQNILEKLKADKHEYERISSNLTGIEKEVYDSEFNRKYFEYFDEFIDKYNSNVNWLRISQVADIVYNSQLYFDNVKYKLHCFTIMPNHIHIILEPLWNNDNYYAIADIIHSLKGYTARKCNEVLMRKGQFWQHGHYDHIIKNAKDYNYQLHYVINNPVKAGLVSSWEKWKYTYVDPKIELD